MSNTSVTLGDDVAAFVEDQVSMGRYPSATDVVRAGLKLLEEREATLEEALAEGEESGFDTPFDFDAFIARKHAERSPK